MKLAVCYLKQLEKIEALFYGYMTIQIRTTQIPTIQILEKIFKRLYLNKLFEFEKN